MAYCEYEPNSHFEDTFGLSFLCCFITFLIFKGMGVYNSDSYYLLRGARIVLENKFVEIFYTIYFFVIFICFFKILRKNKQFQNKVFNFLLVLTYTVLMLLIKEIKPFQYFFIYIA